MLRGILYAGVKGSTVQHLWVPPSAARLCQIASIIKIYATLKLEVSSLQWNSVRTELVIRSCWSLHFRCNYQPHNAWEHSLSPAIFMAENCCWLGFFLAPSRKHGTVRQNSRSLRAKDKEKIVAAKLFSQCTVWFENDILLKGDFNMIDDFHVLQVCLTAGQNVRTHTPVRKLSSVSRLFSSKKNQPFVENLQWRKYVYHFIARGFWVQCKVYDISSTELHKSSRGRLLCRISLESIRHCQCTFSFWFDKFLFDWAEGTWIFQVIWETECGHFPNIEIVKWR